MKNSKNARAKLIGRKEQRVLVFKENPLFDYFSDDERASAVVIEDGKIKLIGDKEVSQNFNELGEKELCIAQPYFSFRKGNACSAEFNDWFQYPLIEERRFLTDEKKIIGQAIEEITQEMKVDDTERTVSEHIRNSLCAIGYSLYYEPVVAFDQNTLNIWNRPGEANLKKVMYIEVASKKNGLTILYSNSFLATGEDSYVSKYRESIEAQEIVKRVFVEGNSTSMLSTKLEKYRNSQLYLTTPLYPYSYHPVPGEESTVRTGDVAVFDLWASTFEFSFRRKIVAIAGSYRASIV
ncbi:MAG: hypothetical protein ACP5UZ_07515 [Thermoplasmata archaeon]